MRVFPEFKLVDPSVVLASQLSYQQMELELSLASAKAVLDPLTPLPWWLRKPGFGNEPI